jgi:hypothetical protein
LGFHYPRSGLTQAACQEHQEEFMRVYGFMTRGVPVNLYAVASHDSLVDYSQFIAAFRGKVQFVEVDPREHGLQNVEGVVLTGERHIIIEKARDWFAAHLGGHVVYNSRPETIDDDRWDLTVDCTFCANDAENIDRFEPCITGLIAGPTHKAVTIMDGPFGSIYPWNEARGLCSLTSAALTPLSKTCRTWVEAKALLDATDDVAAIARCEAMLEDMAHFYPAAASDYQIVDYRKTIRAMPRSAADSRLVDVVSVGKKALRVRAGKIDAVFHAERQIKEWLAS